MSPSPLAPTFPLYRAGENFAMLFKKLIIRIVPITYIRN